MRLYCLADHVARCIDPHLVSAGPHRAENPARERAARGRHDRLHGMGGGLAHHFAVESDELRLKTNVRGGLLSARCCRYQRANNRDRRRPETLRLSRSQPCFGRQQFPIAAFVGRGPRRCS